MYRHLNDIPIAGGRPEVEPQATVDELSNLFMPVINHPGIAEVGFSVTHLSMDSDPELYEVRKVWVRTIRDTDRAPHELGLWAQEHPTLGKVLFGDSTTEIGNYLDSWWNALRDSRYRDAVLATFGNGDITVSRTGITMSDEFDPFDKDWR
jgi:hypothetical protein